VAGARRGVDVHNGTVDIVAALFTEGFDLRQAAGPSTRIDLTGVYFSMAAPAPLPVTIEPHLVVLLRCPSDESGNGALETVFRRDGEQVARNVQPVSVEPGRFGYRLVRAELTFDDDRGGYGTVEAHCRIDHGHVTVVPLTLLPPA
jgi:hypothetical protein